MHVSVWKSIFVTGVCDKNHGKAGLHTTKIIIMQDTK